MGQYENMRSFVKVIKNDEILNRLLYYPTIYKSSDGLDPLDASLPNILELDPETLKDIREKRFMLVPKTEDLDREPLCRLYIYAGGRNPESSYHLAWQEIVIDILCHMDYEEDLRSMRIGDRLNELLVREKITGISTVNYVQGSPIGTVPNYVQYQHVYKFKVGRK
ncbi:hypothetical protein [Bacillus sp. AG4(2022)]|uniref:hypothetical protein n=1 Tax=Bacillus sp. AG4(2022) TaxID=2962594 RepID=UPI002880FFDF|nr:hypothetical protein [Bacillus sp. AG4(2022)]MDT0160275.1 hypothetical protein [Bacillus sp. AG4(2022)]